MIHTKYIGLNLYKNMYVFGTLKDDLEPGTQLANGFRPLRWRLVS